MTQSESYAQRCQATLSDFWVCLDTFGACIEVLWIFCMDYWICWYRNSRADRLSTCDGSPSGASVSGIFFGVKSYRPIEHWEATSLRQRRMSEVRASAVSTAFTLDTEMNFEGLQWFMLSMAGLVSDLQTGHEPWRSSDLPWLLAHTHTCSEQLIELWSCSASYVQNTATVNPSARKSRVGREVHL